MPHRKKPGIPGLFGVQEAKKGPSGCDVFWGNAKGVAYGKPQTLPAASLRFWDLNLRG